MRSVATVFKKELTDTLRDRRALIFMIIIPLLVFPLVIQVMISVSKRQERKAQAKTLRVAVLDQGNAPRFVQMLRERSDLELVANVPSDSLAALIRSDSLDGAFLFAASFDDDVAEMRPGRVDFYFKTTDESGIVQNRLRETVERYEKELLDERFRRLELDQSIVEAVNLESHNIASIEERIGKSVGGIVPYMFILFCFMGAMYPAIDLGAGEKERGTMETLLTAPVNRFHILLGKFGVVVVSGLVSAAVSILGLALAIKLSPDMPKEFLDVILKVLGWDTIVLLMSLLVPLTIFFSGLLLSVSLAARSFKEAQSLISPLNIAVVLPAGIGLTPGIELNFANAWIPVLNVSLATKEILAGTIRPTELTVVYVSLITLAIASLWGSAWWFRRESTIFRS